MIFSKKFQCVNDTMAVEEASSFLKVRVQTKR